MIIRPQYLLAFGAVIFGAAPASAQSINSYAHQVFSGLTVTENGTNPGNSTSFGLNAGNNVTFGSGTYSLVDVREFALLLNSVPSSLPTLSNATLPTTSVIGGKDNVWNQNSKKSQLLLWGSSSNGSGQNGQLIPGDSTGNVFDMSGPLAKNTFSSYGFDIAVKVGNGESDPFGNGVTAGGISTGRVFENFSAPAVPEASTATGFMGVLMCSGVTLLRRRKSK